MNEMTGGGATTHEEIRFSCVRVSNIHYYHVNENLHIYKHIVQVEKTYGFLVRYSCSVRHIKYTYYYYYCYYCYYSK